MPANTLPKSLHTVSVLIQFARHLAVTGDITDAHAAVARAANIMFDGNPPADQYGLRVIAARKLATEFNRSK